MLVCRGVFAGVSKGGYCVMFVTAVETEAHRVGERDGLKDMNRFGDRYAY